MKRRDFIKRTAIASGAIAIPIIIPPGCRGKNGTTPPSDRIIMGGIGLGGMGTGDMKNFLNNKAVQYVAVCDVDKSHRDASTEIINKVYENTDSRSYNDYREFLDKEKLDAVHMALPDHWHAIPAIEAANKGLNIYGQKPLARSIAEGRAIVNAVTKNKITWQTGSQQRSEARFLRACELVRNGRIGKVHRVEVGLPDGGHKAGQPEPQPVPNGVDWDMWLGPAPKVPYRGVLHGNWRWMLDYSGGQLTDWAGHHIDIAHWGLDLERTGPVEIEGVGEYNINDMFNVPYAYDIKCKYANGIEMRIANQSKYNSRSGIGWDEREKTGSFGMGAVWYGDEGWLQVNRSGMWSDNPSVLESEIKPNEIRLYKSENHYNNFIDCVKSGKETIAPAEVGLRSISVALLGEIAMTTGEKLQWNPKTEKFLNSDRANQLLMKPYTKPWKLPRI
ncbi:Gfo/Idh/MocA family oxidoreductase [Prolixibacteraceae bacterium Z1-6]|uniref:Gfo/Idh/MocA family oxidoreductase n=1 Tax=Draconibacterium aestuarii TaxID=2998507 RepID=A0A9X3F893_9BACT|nr:Gfo/Idh/MocA family oxidoreductase [Prolixibacteraceae bacterium Z1-6]